MSTGQRLSLFALRIAMGWMFFYAGITKVLNPEWTAEGYLKGAKMMEGMYQFLLSPEILPIVNFVNAWGLTLLGVSLILGIFVRLSASLGMLLMALYYIPLGFPMPNPNSYIVDQHVVYFLSLAVIWSMNAGRVWGFDARRY